MAKNIAYWDCPAGIAGDMCLGALVSAGVPLDDLSEIVQRLGLEHEIKLWAESVHRGGQVATKVHVEILKHRDRSTSSKTEHSQGEHHEHQHHQHTHRHLPEIEQMIRNAKLKPRVEAWSLKIFSHLAIAEGKVHDIAPEQVHFHEVGALDAIADIVCTCAGLDWLDVDRVYCSAMPTGGGFVNCEHGRLPVPVPAVLKLWEMHEVPIFSNGIDKELVTPTGAAIAVALSTEFGEPPTMKLKRVGLGAGSQDLSIPNILRLWLGKEKKGKKKD